MPRRLWTGVGALALGSALLVAAQLASASRGFRYGGTLQVGMAGASVQIDPQLAYTSTSWWLEYATAAKLFNYPDRAGPAGGVLQPEVVSSFSVSRDGRTYTFTIRDRLHFSDGAPVNAEASATRSTGRQTMRWRRPLPRSSPIRTARTSSAPRRSATGGRRTCVA